MATFSRPGVYVQEVALPQAVAIADTSSAVGAFAGALPKGSIVSPVKVSTWSDFTNTFGGLSDLYPTTWAAYNFFANGGRDLYVKRVVGSGATAASTIINDGSGTTTTATVTAASATGGVVTYTATNTFTVGQTVSITGLSTAAFNLSNVIIATRSSSQFTVANAATGTAVTGASATATATTGSNPVFTINSSNPGIWGNAYSVQIVAAGTASRFGLNVYQAVTTNGTSTNTLVETYNDLSMSPTDKNYVLSVINSANGSSIKILSAGIDNTKTPAVLQSQVPLIGGTDGAAVARTDLSTAWTSFDVIPNPLVVYAPDAPYASTATLTAQIHGDAVTYAASRPDAFAVIDTPSGMTVSAAQAQIAATKAIFSASTTGNIAAAYFPWVNIPDATKSIGATRLQAPGAGVVGTYLATDASRGPAKTPAGLNTKVALAVSTELAFSNADLDSLNTGVNPINAIRPIPGANIVIMGGRTLDNTPDNRYINIRRSLIYIEKQIANLTQFAVFENNDSRLWLQIRTSINSFLLSYWQAGGLRGSNPSQAFYVNCDDTTTDFTDIQAGIVNVVVGVALEYPAEFVVIKLGQLTGNASA